MAAVGLEAPVLGIYAATYGPLSIGAEVSQQALYVAAVSNRTVVEVTSQAAYMAYRTNIRVDNRQRAWAFEMDGHTYYVLSLGVSETWVYDFTTGQWSKWDTQGFPIWNAEVGTRWGDRVVAAGFQEPTILSIEPDLPLDEGFRQIKRRVTGIINTRGRNFVSAEYLTITASAGDAQLSAEVGSTATMSLSYSDDQGQNYITFATLTLSSTDTEEAYDFWGLGSFNAPGRVFLFEDVGGPVRIDGADIDVQGGDL